MGRVVSYRTILVYLSWGGLCLMEPFWCTSHGEGCVLWNHSGVPLMWRVVSYGIILVYLSWGGLCLIEPFWFTSHGESCVSWNHFGVPLMGRVVSYRTILVYLSRGVLCSIDPSYIKHFARNHLFLCIFTLAHKFKLSKSVHFLLFIEYCSNMCIDSNVKI